MTEKQYYENVNLQSLETTVIGKGITEENEHYVILKETIFYPTGGGQPHDTGWINGIEVYYSTDLRQLEGDIDKTLIAFRQDTETGRYKMEMQQVPLLAKE